MKRISLGGGVDGGSDGDEVAEVAGVAAVDDGDLMNISRSAFSTSSAISSSSSIAIAMIYYVAPVVYVRYVVSKKFDQLRSQTRISDFIVVPNIVTFDASSASERTSIL